VLKENPKDTSQLCSGCGERVPKELSESTHRCPKCGLVADQDLNAALNIFHRSGQDRRALTLVQLGRVACDPLALATGSVKMQDISSICDRNASLSIVNEERTREKENAVAEKYSGFC